MFQSDKTKPLQLIDYLYVAAVNLLPNQGSNLDFTDPESVVLPITPLGIEFGCKNTLFLNVATNSKDFFSIFFLFQYLL